MQDVDGWKHGKYNVILPLVKFYQPAVTNGFIGALHPTWHLMSLFVTLSELVLLLNADTPAFSYILWL